VQAHFSNDGYVKRVWIAIQEFYNSMTMPEHEMLLTSGIDAVAYLRLLWMTFQIFFCATLVTFPTLLPLDWKAHNKGKILAEAKIANISLKDFTITGVKDKTLYGHIAAGYGLTSIVLVLIWWSTYILLAKKSLADLLSQTADAFLDSAKHSTLVQLIWTWMSIATSAASWQV
jgi:hypothetical protein